MNLKESLSALHELEFGAGQHDYRRAEELLLQALEPLLNEEGYQLEHTLNSRDEGFDLIARKDDVHTQSQYRIGIEFKHFRKPAPVHMVRSLLGAALLADVNRAILVCNSSFTKAAHKLVARETPVRIDLFGFNELRSWADRLSSTDQPIPSGISAAIRTLSRQLALIVARDPNELRQMEWLDTERMIAEVFEGLGFDVTLTPSAKDGGKDVILGCILEGQNVEYYVEIKHWRSRTKVGCSSVKDFVKIVLNEKKAGGLFLSSYGYNNNAFEHLSEIDRELIKFGDNKKIVALCRTYSKMCSGLWSPPESLPEVLLEDVLSFSGQSDAA